MADGSFVVTRDDWSLHRQGYIDQQRHDEKVQQAVRDNLADLVTEESVILSDGNTVVKVPVKSLDEYRFRFDPNDRAHVGQGDGSSRPGDVLGPAGAPSGPGSGPGAGDEPGVDYYEAEVSFDELAEHVFAGLGLPRTLRQEMPRIDQTRHEFRDVRRHGVMANIDRRRTLLAALQRSRRRAGFVPPSEKVTEHTTDNSEGATKSRLVLSPDDLRYKTWEDRLHKHAHAVVLAMMDTSGSMGSFEKFIARSFFFWMVRFLRTRYDDVDILFLAHDTRAQEVTEQQFFAKGESGGTRCSSVYALALDIIADRYPGQRHNIYPFHFSDGDNFPSDNERAVELMDRLLSASIAGGYAEIVGRRPQQNDTLFARFEGLDAKGLTRVTIRTKRDVYGALKAFFHGPPAEAV